MGIDNARPFRIAFVGAGTHANNLLYPSLSFIDDFNVERVAVCDLDEAKARRTARLYGAGKVYTECRRMFDSERLDGVVVCINAKGHPPVIKAALEAGLDVFVEKPASVTVEEAQELLELSRSSNRFVMVDHQKRRAAAYARALEIAGSPAFGPVRMIESKMHGHPYENLFNCLMEWDIHNIDIVRAFGGDVAEVIARKTDVAANRAVVAALLVFEGGAVATLNWGTEAGWGRFCERVEVVGSNQEGVIVENVRYLTHYRHDTSTEWAPNWIPIVESQTPLLDGYVGNLRAFMEGVFARRCPHPDLEDEIAALRVLYEIARQTGIKTEWTMTVGKR